MLSCSRDANDTMAPAVDAPLRWFRRVSPCRHQAKEPTRIGL